MDAPLITCPVCHAIDPDCLGCGGCGKVAAAMQVCPCCEGGTCRLCAGGLVTRGAVANCPACTATICGEPAYTRRRCPYCDRTGWVLADDVDGIEAELDDEADANRMGRRGYHTSGVRFEGPV